MSPAPDRTEYEAFGLTIDAGVPLPALPRVDRQDPDGSADAAGPADAPDPAGPLDTAPLVVRETSIEPDREDLARDATLLLREPDSFELYRDGEDIHWSYDDLGKLRIRGGRRIDVDLEPSVDPATRQHLVLGPGAYSALVQRGRPVIHGCAVAIDGQAVVVAGATGRGKSTTAAACYAAGHELLGDDLAAMALPGEDARIGAGLDDAGSGASGDDEDGAEAPVRVDPAFPSVRVDEAVADALDLAAVGPGMEAGEVAIDVSGRFREEPAPLAGVYLLEADDGPPRSEALGGPEALFELQRTTYLLAPGTDVGALADHQRACAEVARRAPVRRLVRSDSLDDVDELVSVLEDDVAARDSE